MKNSTLGLFLNLGESFTSLGGQAELMISQNITAFSKAFRKVYVFTYSQESVRLPQNCVLVTPPFSIHRYFYALLLPIIHGRIIRQCNLLRCFQLAGTLPAIISKLVYGTKFVFNYGYDYAAFARIEGKPIQVLGFKLLKKIASRLATSIIVKNKNLKVPGFYLPNGIDTKLFKPKPKQSSKIPVVLFIGRLEPQKNLTVLLTALNRIKRKVKVIFVGQGSQRQKLLDQAKKLQLNLIIHDQITHSQLPKTYQSADIFVLPSLIEGSPKVLLEAMACGLPIVATDVTDVKAGIIVEPTVTGLTVGINRLLSDPQLAHRLGDSARREAVRHYNQDTIIKSEIKFLQSCAR